MIAMGGIIGGGIFVGSATAIHIAGPAVALTYVLCGMLVFVIMRMLGEMALAHPGRGTFTAYAALGLGEWAGFVTGWLYFYFWVVTIAFEALAAAPMLAPWVPLPLWLIATGLIGVVMAINLASVRTYGEFEFWFATLKVFTIVGFILLGLAWIFGFGPGPGAVAARFVSHGGLFPNGVGAVFAAIPVVIFSMMGSEAATIAAVETADPAGNIVRAGRTVSLRILVFYVGSIIIILSVLPWDGVIPKHSPFTQAMAAIHVPGAAAFMGVVAFTAVASCLNSSVYITSRMLHEMAGCGDAPAALGRVSARKVPARAILVSCGAGFIVVLSAITSPDGIYQFLLESSGATILGIYMLITFAQIRLRQAMDAAGQSVPVRMWLFPWASYGCAGGIVAVLAMMLAMPDQRRAICLALLAAAVAVVGYRVRPRR